MDYHLGTVGFGYKDWDAVFYPVGTPAREYLKNYARVFNSVEIDSTFYGTPRVEQVKNWSNTCSSAFKFCFKTPRYITHDMGLQRVDQEMIDFIKAISVAESKLGPVLIQLPPSYQLSEREQLKAFLEKLPQEFKYALEFRHLSWFKIGFEKTQEILSKNNICWVTNDYAAMPKEIIRTSDFVYFRFIGKHNRYPKKDHERLDLSDKLQDWSAKLSLSLDNDHDNSKSCSEVFAYFNNDYSGHSPATCNKFKKILGLTVNEPEIYEQVSLL